MNELRETQPGVLTQDDLRVRLQRTALTFCSDGQDPFVPYAVRLIADFCGLRLEAHDSQSQFADLHLYYGNDSQRPCRLRIPEVYSYGLRSVPRVPSQNDFHAAQIPGIPFPFDIIRALRFWLTDEGNSAVPQAGFDVHDRLLASYSAQEALGVREIPIVNSYLLLLRVWLEARCSCKTRRLLPPGKKCAIVLSHDVDNPINPTDLSHRLWLSHMAARKLKPRRAAAYLRDGALAVRDRLSGRKDRYDLFRDIMQAEHRHDFRSTFFFASVSRLEGHPLDVTYDIGAPRFRRITRELISRGWDIGLHISYDARESWTRIAAEKKKLESLVERPVQGSRHHYWHMERPFWRTLVFHERAGLLYDTSIAFNEAPGYRLGIAYPFRPWNPYVQREVATLQICTVLMDGGYFYVPKQIVQGAIKQFQFLLDELKKYEGIAAIDWHEHTAYPGSALFREWGKAYLAIIDLLAADPAVEVCSYAQVLSLLHRHSHTSSEALS